MNKILICMPNNRDELYWRQYFRKLFFPEEVEITVWYTEQPDASIFCVDNAQVTIRHIRDAYLVTKKEAKNKENGNETP